MAKFVERGNGVFFEVYQTPGEMKERDRNAQLKELRKDNEELRDKLSKIEGMLESMGKDTALGA